jgi:hypothetical protein
MRKQDLIEFINIECENIEKTISEVIILNKDLINKSPSNIEIAAIAFFLSSIYNGFENIFKRICKFHKINLPKGEFYHIELMNLFYKSTFSELPVLITDQIVNQLRELRKFRHVSRQGYITHLDWERIRPIVGYIESIYNEFNSNLNKYLNNVTTTLQ